MSDNYDRKYRSASNSEVATRKIFIGGLSYDTTDENLKKYFSVYGSIEDSVVMKDPTTKRSRGFGFITFSSISSVDNSLLEQHSIDGRRVEVKRAVPKSEDVTATPPTKVVGLTNTPEFTKSATSIKPTASPIVPPKKSAPPPTASKAPPYPVQTKLPVPLATPTKGTRSNSISSTHSSNADDANKFNAEEYALCKIFVGGLHYDTRDADFKEYFSKYGTVLYGEVMFNRETRKSRGFGFIVFESEDSVDLVCEDSEHYIRDKAVEVKRAIPRSMMSAGSSPATSAGNSTPSSAETSPREPLATSKPVSSNPSITPIRPTNRRAVSGNATTVLLGTNAVPQQQVKKPLVPTPTKPASAVSSYAAALLQGSESAILSILTDGFSSSIDVNSSELDATTTIASQSSKGSVNYDNDFNISTGLPFDSNRPGRAFSEPVIQLKGLNSPQYALDLGGSLFTDSVENSPLDTGRSNMNDPQGARPLSLSFDHLGPVHSSPSSGIQRPASVSPPLAWSQFQQLSQTTSAETLGSISDALGLSWISSSQPTGLSPLNSKLSNSPFQSSFSYLGGQSESFPLYPASNNTSRSDISWPSPRPGDKLVGPSQGNRGPSHPNQSQQSPSYLSSLPPQYNSYMTSYGSPSSAQQSYPPSTQPSTARSVGGHFPYPGSFDRDDLSNQFSKSLHLDSLQLPNWQYGQQPERR